MNIGAFYPLGNTVLVAATSSTGVAATQISTNYVPAAMLSNPSSVSVYVALGSSSVAAAQPTTAAPAVGMCLAAGEMRPVGLGITPTYAWISAVTSAGTAPPGIFATPGQMSL